MAEVWIRLLGDPEIIRAGENQVQPRGRKVWALLAYLILGPGQVTRRSLVSLLFADAADPFGALRWNLSELRRALGPEVKLWGNPLTLLLPAGWHCDVVQVLDPSASGEVDLSGLDGQLLEGISFSESGPFEVWLTLERQRLAVAIHTLIYEKALSALAAGSPQIAAGFAAKVAAMDPFNSDYQALLIRALVANGDHELARRQFQLCGESFKRELGIGLPAEVKNALVADKHLGGPMVPASAVTVRAYLDAARASRDADAVDRAIDQLRSANELAERTGQSDLRAECLVALATGMIHSLGSQSPEVEALLHKSLTLIPAEEASPSAASAYLALGWLSALRGTPESAFRWLDTAERCAKGLPGHMANILGAKGVAELDLARYERAQDALQASAELAAVIGDRRRRAFALAHIGRCYLLQGAASQAADALDEALAILGLEHWMAFAPFVEALRGEVFLAEGKFSEATEIISHAVVLADLSSNNAWRIVAATAQAKLHTYSRDTGTVQQNIHQGLALAPRWTWARGRLLDAACEVAMEVWSSEAERHAHRLTSLAGGSGMRELVVRAYSHRGVLGDAAAAKAVPFLVQGIRNPALESYLVARNQLPLSANG